MGAAEGTAPRADICLSYVGRRGSGFLIVESILGVFLKAGDHLHAKGSQRPLVDTVIHLQTQALAHIISYHFLDLNIHSSSVVIDLSYWVPFCSLQFL
jgi:hypothetical protein